MGVSATMLSLMVVGAALLILPGGVALQLSRTRYQGLGALSASIGLSLALLPIGLLWSSSIGLRWGSESFRALLLACAVVYFWRRRSSSSDKAKVSEGAADDQGAFGHNVAQLSTAAVIVIALVLRMLDAGALAVPAWVDGYHHTMIAQKIIDVGGVPSDLRPWLAVDRFYYHFGFHSLAAALVWLGGFETHRAVLFAGQALVALVVLPTWWLARRLTGSEWAAAFASAIPATLYWFPAYFVAWGRYTQLAGLVLLPVALILLWDAIAEQKDDRTFRTVSAAIMLASVAAAGLVLVHYRVAVFYAIGALIALCGAMLKSDSQGRVLVRWSSVAALGGVLAAPWLIRYLLPGMRALDSISDSWYTWDPSANQIPTWLFTIGDNRIWIAIGAIGLIAALLAGRAAAVATVVALGAAAAAASPSTFGLSSSWMLPSFSVVISLFLPIAIGVAFLVSELLCAFNYRPPSKNANESALISINEGEKQGFQRSWFNRVEATFAASLISLVLIGAWRMHGKIEDGALAVRSMDNPTKTEIFTAYRQWLAWSGFARIRSRHFQLPCVDRSLATGSVPRSGRRLLDPTSHGPRRFDAGRALHVW